MDQRTLHSCVFPRGKFISAFVYVAMGLLMPTAAKAQQLLTHTIPIFSDVHFYDGYAGRVNTPLPEGLLRHRNDLFARRLTDEERQQIGSSMTMQVRMKPACDNYDRIGSVHLALVPKGATSYNPDSVQRIELGRFITPFMNKNLKPDLVSYDFALAHLTPVFHDQNLVQSWDFWVELEVFGVPYAAQNEVTGCRGRNDVYFGSLDFFTNDQTNSDREIVLIPLNFKKPLNNYAPGASDSVGQTVRTIQISLETAVQEAHLYLITSNHGANAGGEEYNRRLHSVRFDGVEVLRYTPGGISCEPYRKYNTQGNGIYGRYPRPPAEWASFSNWCPGQGIPLRDIGLGYLSAGKHVFQIAVPDAVFQDAQGDIPVSLYLQGYK